MAAEVEERATDVKQTGKTPQIPLLDLCREEMRRAVGFEQDAELRDDRERALRYMKNDMSKDIPSLPNRSKAVSSDISDAVETILPDLMEIFTGGDDVVAFIPEKEEDVEAAEQETAFLNHVIFQDNDGFLNFYTAFKDALILKNGIFMAEWVVDIEDKDEDFTGKNVVELQAAAQDGDVSNVKAEDVEQGQMPTYSFTVTRRRDKSKMKYWAVPPDDFAVSPDTINIADTTYCCMRSRPRVQDLIAQGYDEAAVRQLEPYAFAADQVMQLARDNAGESLRGGNVPDNTSDDLRQVEIRKHYIRCLNEENELQLWCVVTDTQASVEIDREEVERIPYSAGSPYLVCHRFYGRSLADMLVEIQKIKTALMRMVLDSGYFALNQRLVVGMDQASEYTISDLLRQEPGSPIRAKSTDAVAPLNSAGLGFDAYQALEYFSTVAEGRTGVVRNAQGLNPDTLHDTASGAMMLLSAAQKRTKMIARIMAETLVKPLYLMAHALIRENSQSTRIANLLGKWVPVDPTKWHERDSMTVQVGLGAAGKDMEIAAIEKIAGLMTSIVQEQGGASGPIVTMDNVYAASTDFAKKLGMKAPDRYFSDPQKAPPQPPKPDPEMAKVQSEMQLKQLQMQADQQHQRTKAQMDHQASQDKIASEQAIASQKAQLQAAADMQAQQLEHERMQAQQANQMAIEQMKIESSERIAIEVARINAEAKISAAMAAAKIDQQTTLAYEEKNEATP